jgi:hypothetical protein
MNKILHVALIPALMIASLSSTLIPAGPAAADKHILTDVGIGAGASLISGGIRHRGTPLNNAFKGAAAGAAVNAVHGTRHHKRRRNFGQDVAVGAAASTVTGAVTRGRRDTLGDAVDGAAAGAAIHLLTNGKRR